MKLVGLTICRNEEWIVGLTARAALQWVDELVVLDHASTDGTPGILRKIAAEYPKRLHVLQEPDPDWAEMRHRQRTLEYARKIGATHLAICDADELLTGNLIGRIRQWVFHLKPGQILNLPMLAMWRSLYTWRSDKSIWSNRKLLVAFGDHPWLSWQPRADGYEYHNRKPANGPEVPMCPSNPLKDPRRGGVMHLQFVDRSRLIAKHARYKMLERIRYPTKPVQEIDQQYNQAIDAGAVGLERTPPEWWSPWRPWMKYLNLHAPIWQVEDCKTMLAQHGRDTFEGLNLWGVV